MLERKRVIGVGDAEAKRGPTKLDRALETTMGILKGPEHKVTVGKVKEKFLSHEPKLDKDGHMQVKPGTEQTKIIRARTKEDATEKAIKRFGPSPKKT